MSKINATMQEVVRSRDGAGRFTGTEVTILVSNIECTECGSGVEKSYLTTLEIEKGETNLCQSDHECDTESEVTAKLLDAVKAFIDARRCAGNQCGASRTWRVEVSGEC